LLFKVRYSTVPRLLPKKEHDMLKSISYHVTQNTKVEFTSKPQLLQDIRTVSSSDAEAFIRANYFLEPTFRYNKTNLLPAPPLTPSVI
jgi:hypothetical protein